VADFHRNGWPDCVGISGRLGSDYARWRPKRVGYERYGLQSDLEHIRREQHLRNVSFPITELGGSTPKVDRIRKLVPLFEGGQFLLPYSLHRTQYDGKTVDLIRALVEEEYVTFPHGAHDDMLDAMARICDPDLKARVPMSGALRGGSRQPRVVHSAAFNSQHPKFEAVRGRR
jgi:hypothetical protein